MRSAVSLLRRVVSPDRVIARAPRRCRGFTPQLECLEDRLVMSTWVVNPTPGKGNYTTIQAAVNAAKAGDTINIDYAKGYAYTEQVVVNKNLTIETTPGQAAATIEAPTGALTGSQVIVDFTGTTVTSATLENLNIMGPGTGLKAGVDVEQGASGVTITNDTIGNVHEQSSIRSGIQVGIGVLVGGDTGGTYTAGSATISSNAITGYQKAGIVVENAGSSATITDNTIKGAGSTNAIAEDGVEVGFGATATITDNTVTNNIYGLSSPTGSQAVDILLYQPGAGTTVTDNAVTNSDVGIWALDASGGSITDNSVNSFNYDGIVLDIVSTGCANEKVNDNGVGGGGTGTNAGIVFFNATNCTANDNTVTNCGEGIWFFNSTSCAINNNAVKTCGEGIWLAGGDTSNTITNNAVKNSTVDGIVIADYDGTQPNDVGTTSTSSGNTIKNNSATGSGTWDALDVSTGSGSAGTANTWKNNTFNTKDPSGLK